MSVKVQRLRVLVNERLTAAAEEIVALFERTIVEYEEEVCRSEEENKRKQQLLDSGLKPLVLLHRTDVLKNHVESRPSQKSQENSLCIQEEQQEVSIKHEIAEFSFIVGEEQTEEQTENSSVTDNDDDWGPLSSSSAQQKKTNADGRDPKQVQRNNPDRRTQETINGELSVFGVQHKMIKRHLCPYCGKSFSRNADLKRHIRSHTGERPFSCSVCNKSFTRNFILKSHMSIHMKEKPVRCEMVLGVKDVPKRQGESGPSVGQEIFNSLCFQEKHRELIKHGVTEFTFIPGIVKDEDDLFPAASVKTEENREDCGGAGPDLDPRSQTENNDNGKPLSSSSSQQKERKADGDDPNRVQSNRFKVPDRRTQETRNRERSVFGVRRKMIKKHVCPSCGAAFSRNAELERHIRSHTGEKPFSCSVCNKCFTRKAALKIHMVIHTKEKPFRCSECDSRFTQRHSLVAHMRTVH